MPLFFRFGPLINHWTTRFEAKHKYFKHLANVMGNFKNICYSLALRHQLYRCYLSLNTDTLSTEDIEVGPGKMLVAIQWVFTIMLRLRDFCRMSIKSSLEVNHKTVRIYSV